MSQEKLGEKLKQKERKLKSEGTIRLPQMQRKETKLICQNRMSEFLEPPFLSAVIRFGSSLEDLSLQTLLHSILRNPRITSLARFSKMFHTGTQNTPIGLCRAKTGPLSKFYFPTPVDSKLAIKATKQRMVPPQLRGGALHIFDRRYVRPLRVSILEAQKSL